MQGMRANLKLCFQSAEHGRKRDVRGVVCHGVSEGPVADWTVDAREECRFALSLHEAEAGFRDVGSCGSERAGAPDVSPIKIPCGKLIDLDGAQPKQTGLCGTRYPRHVARSC